ncbi:unnamed protein product [Allacma fusca]|uniref:CRAL-TRIO domain-containing protein n=1 Tax=Allacma fusca TaxID=39272 RepID=A0A8J2J647_9HEXA|nr:unnamed protein product [Allacma fusca]
MASFITKESEMISQLRLKLSDLQLKDKFNTDHFLLRWIRAGKHNLILAEKIFREHMTWREENDMDNILSWTPPEILLTSCPIKFLGYDKDNSPVRLISMGKTSANFGVIDLILQQARRFEAHFPETVKTIFIINCNAVFAAIFSLAKPLMSKATLDKLQIFSTRFQVQTIQQI